MRVLILIILTLSLTVRGDDRYTKYLVDGVSLSDPGVQLINCHRPWRNGCIRIEVEERDGIPIIHNYGHGGSGLTLSPGSAMLQLKLAEPYLKPGQKILIVGAGVMGKTVAKLAAEKGYRPEIYANTNEPLQLASGRLAGLWSPVSAELGEGAILERTKWTAQQSYDYFENLMGVEWGIHRVPIFVADDPNNPGEDKSGMATAAEWGIVPKGIRHNKLPIQGVNRPGDEFETLLIDPGVYMPRLEKAIADLNVPFTPRMFANPSEILKVARVVNQENPVVFNCTGLGAGELFNDPEVVPVRGLLVWVPMAMPELGGGVSREDLIRRQAYMLFFGTRYRMYRTTRNAQTGALEMVNVLGGTFQAGEDSQVVDRNECAAILKEHQTF